MELGEKLKKLRKERGISQKQLADAIYVSRSAVAKWENGLGFPSKTSYDSLVQYFDVSEQYFETEEPEAIIFKKNRKIRNYSISIYAVLAVFLLSITVCFLYQPVPFYVSASCTILEISPIREGSSSFQVTNENTISSLLDAVNSVLVRKSMRLSSEAPDNLVAVFQIRNDSGDSTDLWLCSNAHGDDVIYIWTGVEELIAFDVDRLSSYLRALLPFES